MATNQEIYSDLAVPPGVYLTEIAGEMGMSQAELARRMGRPVQAISEIANGIKSITPDTALQLEQVLGVRAYAPAFRQSARPEVSHEALVAWLRGGALEAVKNETGQFDSVKARAALQSFRRLTREKPGIFFPQLKQELANAGIAFVLLPHFPKNYTNGATYWLTPSKAVLMMTIRGGWADIFWFSLFHELGHILLHDKRHTFLEDGLDDPNWKKQEEEADEFAQKTLIPPASWRTFVKAGHFSATNIASFADEIGIAPGNIVGRLQHDDLISPNHHMHRVRYKWAS